MDDQELSALPLHQIFKFLVLQKRTKSKLIPVLVFHYGGKKMVPLLNDIALY